jgi:uncharacterized protein (DUF1697 family)
MARWIAFLRAINVGGHSVRMDALQALFESLGYAHVTTFIASGNVIFETSPENAFLLADEIARCLHQALGYAVAVFVRTPAELADIASCRPFPQNRLDQAAALNIAFLAQELDPAAAQRLVAKKTAIDDFHVHGREIYWLCLKKQSESTFSNAVLEKTLGVQSTLRGANTIQKMAAKYPPVSP